MAQVKVICDTDVMIDYLDARNSRHDQSVFSIEEEIKSDNVVLSSVTKMELMLGATNKKDLSDIKRKLSRYDVALINDKISLFAIELLDEYLLSHGLQLADSLIAATAIILELELFTYNVKDYKFIKGLKLYKINHEI